MAGMSPLDNGGCCILVLPYTVYDCSGLGANASITLPIAARIEAEACSELNMCVRAHATGSVMGAGQSFVVNLMADGTTPHDPTAAFPGIVINSFTQTGAINAPVFAIETATVVNGNLKAFARYCAINIVATQSGVGGTAFKFGVSIELALKGGDLSFLPCGPNTFRGYRLPR